MKKIIELEHLRKAYGAVVAVEDISFEVNEGEIFGLVGPNGAGKTTTVECLQGLRRPDAGRLRVLGLDPQSDGKKLRQRIGSQLQDSALPERIMVWEALDLLSSLVPNSPDWRILMEQWGLVEKRNSSFSGLSGGQRQRLFVALALVNNPRLVFMDEMTSGLDPAARHTAWDLIRAIRDRGTTVLMVTHYMEEAERLCDRLGIVYGGRLMALDTPQSLIATYAGGVRVVFSIDCEDLSWLQDVPDVSSVSRHGPRVEVQGNGPVLSRVAVALAQRGILPTDLRLEQPSLEDVFLSITGHTIQD
jgi:ABC-2 type transport system ATP-binding protein